MRWIGKLEYLETCPIDYLADHHNREGELLLGVPFNPGDTKERVIDELCNAAQASDAYADAFPSHMFQSAVEAWEEADGDHRLSLFWTHRDDGRGGVELPPGADDDESDVQHWFLFTYALELEPGEVVTLPENEWFGYAVLALPGDAGFTWLTVDMRYSRVFASVDRPSPTLAEAATAGEAAARKALAKYERQRGEIVYTPKAVPCCPVRKLVALAGRSGERVSYRIEKPDNPLQLMAHAYVDGAGLTRPWKVRELYGDHASRRYKTEAGALRRMKEIADGKA